jgi:DNA-binding GntR family transcriptional regulator
MTSVKPDGDPRGSAVARCAQDIRRLIIEHELLPGVQIRQAEMAEQLNTSTIPLREALKELATEGILIHSPNQGYFVAILRTSELDQIYLMRRLLESELLKTVRWPAADELAEIRAANDRLFDPVNRPDIHQMLIHNRDFHFKIFALSPQSLILSEVERLWSMSDSYRAIYMHDQLAQKRIRDDHDEIIEALKQGNSKALLFASDHHRAALQNQLSAVLPARGSGQAKKVAAGSSN